MIKIRPFYFSVSAIYILFWTAINLLLLAGFPFMHTDESWLAGLSRAILTDSNPASTEPFFDLVLRAPHALKILFHAAQILFIKLFGYNLFSLRLPSLLSGAAALAVFSSLCGRLKINPKTGVILLSCQIQFIYAAHFGRQEIQVLLLMLISLNALYSAHPGFRRGLFVGLPIAIAIGFHPNAFIAAWPAGLILLIEIIRRKRRIYEGLGFLILPAITAVFFIFLSMRFNSSFVSSYSSFGEEVGTMAPLDIKVLGFDDFYQKLFLRISGTYYTPRIWPVFLLAALASLWLIISRIIQGKPFQKAALAAATGIIGVNIGILLIGKYSAPSIVFVIPALVLLIAAAIERLPIIRLRHILFAAAAAMLLINSILMIMEETGGGRETYSDYQKNIKAVIPEGYSRVLGPLNAEFCLEHGRLLDWRNLSMLREAGISLEEYIQQNNIEYIIYNEEYDLIYKQRPVWNILYGNPTIYHEQLQDFLGGSCEIVAEFESPGYGTRIVFHRFKKDWKVRIYKVK